MTSPVRVTVPRPPQPHYDPSKCAALKDRNDPKVRCGETARMYPCGPRCDGHAPGALRTSRETSPTRQKEAA
jgi:hypothetical protein